MRTLLHVPAAVVNAAFFSAAIGTLIGTLATILTRHLEVGLQAGFCALTIAAACFGRSIWRTYRRQPRQALFFPRPRRH